MKSFKDETFIATFTLFRQNHMFLYNLLEKNRKKSPQSFTKSKYLIKSITVCISVDLCQILSFKCNVLITVLSRQYCVLSKYDAVSCIKQKHDFNHDLFFFKKNIT